MKYGIWGDENENKKTEWFNSEEGAFNYLENNNLDDFKKYFEYDKEEITSYMDKYYEDDFIVPCTISKFLKEQIESTKILIFIYINIYNL